MFISIIALIIGVISIILVAINRFPAHNTKLIVGALLMFAVSIGAYLLNQNEASPSPEVAEQSSTPTVEQPLEQAPISPISPVSPVSTPGPIITEVDVTEIGFEGCLLFTSDRTGPIEIYKMQNDPSNIQKLTDTSSLNIDPKWSPDGQRIAFASTREGEEKFQIYVMNSDGSDQQMVGEAQPGENTHPSWSPDGRQIIFQSIRDTNGISADDNSDIYIMNSDGSEANFLMIHSADDTEPTWSPDGKKIAFLSERSMQDEVYIMNPDGSEVTQLTTLDVLKSNLTWTPDSQYLIFEGNGDIYYVNIETKEVSQLFSMIEPNEATPIWVNDKDLLIFSSDQSGNWDLYATNSGNPAEFSVAQLTDDPGNERGSSWFPCE